MQRESHHFPLRRRVLSRCLAVALAGFSLADAHAGAAHRMRGLAALPAWLEHDAAAQPRQPTGTVVTVQNCNDGGSGSLREAMGAASGDTTIDLDSLTCSTITLTTGALVDPPTAGTVTLQRAGAYVNGRAVPTLTIDGSANGRVIEHDSTSALSVQGLTLRNGNFVGEKGGCVYSAGSFYLDTVVVDDCVLSAPGSTEALGGAIYAKGLLNMNFSTISGSSASSESGYTYGGGVFTPYLLGVFYSTIEGNFAYGIGYGGGIATRGGVLIEQSLVWGNGARYDGGMALFGGALLAHGLMLVDSTVTLNGASGNVGGIEANGELYLYNSTIAFNVGGAGRAGGVTVDGDAILMMYSTIVAHNSAFGVESDIGGAGTVNGSHNLVMVSSTALPPGTITADPELDALADHGGQTMIIPLQPGSPAIDAGNNVLSQVCDQRAGNFSYYFGFITKYPRTVGSNVDIGAYEFGADDEIFPSGFDGPPFLAQHCLVR